MEQSSSYAQLVIACTGLLLRKAYCGQYTDCDNAARDDERESQTQRREEAEADDYQRY
jgi:hypothetical protein